MENWKTITDYVNYQISDLGNVKSLISNKILKASSNDNGYLYVNLVRNKIPKSMAVHKLVILHFGNPPASNNCVVYHLDGNKSNNKLENLEWVSIQENTLRAYGNQKFREEAKKLREQGWSITKIAQAIGKSLSFVSKSIHSPD